MNCINTVKDIALILIASWILLIELFLIPAPPRTFDGWTHLITIQQYYHTITEEVKFPVTWIDGVSNYGMPLGHIAHQTTAYLGALIRLITPNVQDAFNISMYLAASSSAVLMYFFLRRHFSQEQSLLAALVFNIAPYRISNIYLRGALPELFVSTAILSLLLVTNIFVIKPTWGKLLLISLASAFLALTHPMIFLVAMPIILIYTVFMIFHKYNQLKITTLLMVVMGIILGTILASYYLIPLVFESKYLYQGQKSLQPQTEFEFLGLNNFWQESWKFQSDGGSGVRDNRIQLGSFEFISVMLLIILSLVKKKSIIYQQLVIFTLISFFLYAALSLPISQFLYTNAPLLKNIQYPWRMMSVLMLLPPIAIILVMPSKWVRKVSLLIILCLYIFRTPQLYGKNYIQYPDSRYDFTEVNPHSTNMNTIWSSASSSYQIRDNKFGIIDGQIDLLHSTIKPTSREYFVDAKRSSRLVDYTFYYPGWTVYIDNQQTQIQFQDLEYRGLITYMVDAGKHTIRVVYQPTKLRTIANFISILGMLVITISAIYNKKTGKLTKLVKLKVDN